MSRQPDIDDLRRREEMARHMGGPDKIKRQHDDFMASNLVMGRGRIDGRIGCRP